MIRDLSWHLPSKSFFPATVLAFVLSQTPHTVGAQTVTYPSQNDWIDRGLFLQPAAGTWEHRFAGLSPSTIVKKDGRYFLYYIGADGDRADGGPAHRKLGVATSTDGLNWTKYSGNPIVTHNPNGPGADEEGIFSAAALLDGNEIVLFYGAMTGPGTSVRGDVRVARSSDGFTFGPSTEVIDHGDNSVWGFGDELYPMSAFVHNNQWHVYYISKGGSDGQDWDLGLATGPSSTNLPNTQEAVRVGIEVVGASEVIPVSNDTIGILLNRSSDFINVNFDFHIIDKDNPTQFGPVVERQNFLNNGHTTVFYDAALDTWLMASLTFTGAVLRTFSGGGAPPLIRPEAPANVVVE